jgi:DNA-binding NtrC family response regulator
MASKGLLDGKKVLIVDDELDVLDLMEELLPSCDVRKASSFTEGKELLETEYFDIAILDIMGVNGFKLLELANERGVIAVMLTAHALRPENIIRSYREGAASFLPKDEMRQIATFLSIILEAKGKGYDYWWRWLERWESFYDQKFGPDWRKKDEDFWKKFSTKT